MDLPNTPIYPRSMPLGFDQLLTKPDSLRADGEYSLLKNNLLTRRSLLASSASLSDLKRVIVGLDDYIHSLFDYLGCFSSSLNSSNFQGVASRIFFFDARKQLNGASGGDAKGKESPRFSIPWRLPITENQRIERWSLLEEIKICVISIALCYSNSTVNLINSHLIEINDNISKEEYDNKWKSVTNLYKKSLSFMSFLDQFDFNNNNDNHIFELSSNYKHFISNFLNLNLQSIILIKYFWNERYNSIINDLEFGIDNLNAPSKVTISTYSLLIRSSSFVKENLNLLLQLLPTNYNNCSVSNLKLLKNCLNLFVVYNDLFLIKYKSFENYYSSLSDDISTSISLINYGFYLINYEYTSKEGQEFQKDRLNDDIDNSNSNSNSNNSNSNNIDNNNDNNSNIDNSNDSKKKYTKHLHFKSKKLMNFKKTRNLKKIEKKTNENFITNSNNNNNSGQNDISNIGNDNIKNFEKNKELKKLLKNPKINEILNKRSSNSLIFKNLNYLLINLNNFNIKLKKENDNISFNKVHVIGTKDFNNLIPSGMAIPTQYDFWTPHSFDKNNIGNDDVSNDYKGKGAYY
ncbi:uncharacterized protein ASCRUDRAFT_68607 [Ascoidea rubescens DSM 1968]|uniref:Uncharacterized protein n=1 Tax=Ascoidea rubescens DSM 1968 TaxID=1344418 RepID=A0A1D2VMD6_9ASCO|nr:hypothetical protein ASCRUDRAFT_68607 [Ascoidea rubescens DSM 1968]ODV62776.1 hypothetical protein ASCRUDRAFT_68607 [Ascoidea rubescens DSM 1968]